MHRGLLLGTGPIVDPGYWGKLCIPLHNLTDEDHRILQHEGLIWIEFTKTSLTGVTSSGNLPFRRSEGYWCIKDLILKAATPAGAEGGKVIPIRSSIPSMTKVAEEFAKGAESRAEGAERRAQEAATSAESMRRLVFGLGAVGVLAIAIGMLALVVNFFSSIQSAHSLVEQRINKLEEKIDSYDLLGISRRIQDMTKEDNEPLTQ